METVRDQGDGSRLWRELSIEGVSLIPTCVVSEEKSVFALVNPKLIIQYTNTRTTWKPSFCLGALYSLELQVFNVQNEYHR
jgi:hypothetical protein